MFQIVHGAARKRATYARHPIGGRCERRLEAPSRTRIAQKASQGPFFINITLADSLFVLWDQFSRIAAIRIRFQDEGTIFMAAATKHHFSGPVTDFQERRLPERATPAGYSALIGAFDLQVPLPRTLFAIGAHHRITEEGGWRIMTRATRRMPGSKGI